MTIEIGSIELVSFCGVRRGLAPWAEKNECPYNPNYASQAAHDLPPRGVAEMAETVALG
jgi:hypothetical protein